MHVCMYNFGISVQVGMNGRSAGICPKQQKTTEKTHIPRPKTFEDKLFAKKPTLKPIVT